MPPQPTSTVTVPRCGTSIWRSRYAANAGTLRNSTAVTLPSSHVAFTPTRPAGVSSVSSVTGSCISMMPVSSRVVTTQIVFVPLIGGYSTCSMIT